MPNSMKQPTGTPSLPKSQAGLNTAATQSKSLKQTAAGSTPACASQSASGSTVIVLPWPPTELSPNARMHWARLAKAKKAYRAACAWQAKAQGAKPVAADRLHLTLTFYAPTRRAFDLDNALARCKAGLDGLCDVLGVDDSKWSLTIRKADTVGGFVRVEIA